MALGAKDDVVVVEGLGTLEFVGFEHPEGAILNAEIVGGAVLCKADAIERSDAAGGVVERRGDAVGVVVGEEGPELFDRDQRMIDAPGRDSAEGLVESLRVAGAVERGEEARSGQGEAGRCSGYGAEGGGGGVDAAFVRELIHGDHHRRAGQGEGARRGDGVDRGTGAFGFLVGIVEREHHGRVSEGEALLCGLRGKGIGEGMCPAAAGV